ncbi:MAG TPA: MFS transporter [Planctomycetota bacterium]|nr:MFS transporter [Planctomycetota bacterium]
MADPDVTSLERRVVGKVSRRLLPYLFLLYVVAYLDRVNVGVAHLQITRDRPIADSDWGLGVGLFFSGYFLFEVPSNLILARVGARVWIARIMVVWGLVSISMIFIRGAWDFFMLRFLLGVAEAGFFPGILFYLTRWFRKEDRARAIALFMTAGTVTGVIGNPLSGSLLGLDGVAGLKGWQWLFLLEGLPAIVLGVSVLFLLTERPETAAWLSPPERDWLVGELKRAQEKAEGGPAPSLLETLSQPRVLLLGGIYFLVASGGHAFEFWLPDIVKSIIGQDAFRVTLVSAIPYLIATVVMIVAAHHSDRTGERKWHVAIAAFAAAAGFGAAGFLGNPILILGALSIGWSGVKALQAPFWAIPPTFLSGTRSAAGMALINSVGNLGGQVGPWAMGAFLAGSRGYAAGLRFSATLLLAAGVTTLGLRVLRNR